LLLCIELTSPRVRSHGATTLRKTTQGTKIDWRALSASLYFLRNLRMGLVS